MTDFLADNAPSRSQLRWFGLVLLITLGVIGSLLHWRLGWVSAAYLAWGVGIALVVPYYLVPRLRETIFRSWMRLVMPIGWMVSHLLLGVVYFLLITPIGAMQRLFGRDALGRRFDPATRSHWQEHDPGGDTDRYFRQT